MRLILIISLGITLFGCKSQSIYVIGQSCYWWSSNEKDLVKVKKNEVKKQLPLISNISDKEFTGKVIACCYDTTNQVYILELNNKGEKYCIKASNTWKVDSAIISFLPYY